MGTHFSEGLVPPELNKGETNDTAGEDDRGEGEERRNHCCSNIVMTML